MTTITRSARLKRPKPRSRNKGKGTSGSRGPQSSAPRLSLEPSRSRPSLTDADVIAAIRANHLKANISDSTYVRHHWSKAWVDSGGTVFGAGPYVKLPVDWLVKHGSTKTERVVIRVYAPARLQRRLARDWKPTCR